MSTNSSKKKPIAVKPRLIASADTARMLGVDPDTFRNRVLKSLAPLSFVKQGNLYYYRMVDIDHFCEHGRWPESMEWANQPSAEPSLSPSV